MTEKQLDRDMKHFGEITVVEWTLNNMFWQNPTIEPFDMFNTRHTIFLLLSQSHFIFQVSSTLIFELIQIISTPII